MTLLYSSDWKTHLNHLEKVFQRLKDSNLTVKTAKCIFGTEDCVYLGYKIGKGGVKPEDNKIQAIRQVEIPKTKKDVRAFLGMTGYYRRFIQTMLQLRDH